MDSETLLQESPSFRRTVVTMVLIAILLFDWQPDSRLLSTPAQRREADGPLPEHGGELKPQVARPLRSAHLEGHARPLPGGRQAARRRPGRR
jgi:hypothetical protein